VKLHLVNRSSLKNNAFSAKLNRYPYFLKTWHYHPELELVSVIKSTGTRFIGDHIGKFEPGDLVLIGKNLPHMWHNEEAYLDPNSTLMAEAIAVHFREDFLGETFFSLPEMRTINGLLTRSRRGLYFKNIPADILDSVHEVLLLEGFKKTMSFLALLERLAHHKTVEYLASERFVDSFKGSAHQNLVQVYEHVYKNFDQPITLNEIAALAHMNPSAFSRYFKRVNRMTFSRYLNEIRIGYACKLLLEAKYNIATVCYDAGFNNISNFNRQFKAIKGMSPSTFIKKYETAVP